MRLLTAIVLSALAGGLAYGVTVWLAPDSKSALLAVFIVAAITALGVLAPHTLLKATSKDEDKPTSAPDTYFDTSFSIHKDEGWND
ncbi:hypothetical protein BA177_01290 [Woeseia oceani]|uniref:Uncharacterized protein n=1 Tax=Woeseia oceani TaxID=1548547 RepID=A0A193LC77_9GAMM|nr:hypothetical protein BA177_01290 [Woeseia oceani]